MEPSLLSVTSTIAEAAPYIWFSFWQSGLTALVSIVIGGGLAIITQLVYAKPPKWLWVITLLPVFLPHPIVGTALLKLLGDIAPTLLYEQYTVVIAHLYYNIPLAYTLVSYQLWQLPVSLQQSLDVLGANVWQKFRHGILPHAQMAIIQSGLLAFLYSFTSFSLPLIVGGFRAKTLEVRIYEQWIIYHDGTTALTLVIFQALALLCLTYPLARIQRHQETQLAKESGKAAPYWLLSSYVCMAGLIVLPLIYTYMQLPSIQITHSFWPAMTRTLYLGMMAGIIATTLSFFIKRRATLAIILLCISPISVSVISGLLLNKTLAAQLVSYIWLLLTPVVLVYYVRWQSRPHHFDETIALFTDNRLMKWRMQFGWLLPSVISGFFISMVYVMGDYAVASTLAPYNKPTAMQVAMQLMGSYRFSVALNAFLLILVAITMLYALPTIFAYIFTRTRRLT